MRFIDPWTLISYEIISRACSCQDCIITASFMWIWIHHSRSKSTLSLSTPHTLHHHQTNSHSLCFCLFLLLFFSWAHLKQRWKYIPAGVNGASCVLFSRLRYEEGIRDKGGGKSALRVSLAFFPSITVGSCSRRHPVVSRRWWNTLEKVLRVIRAVFCQKSQKHPAVTGIQTISCV